MRRIVVTMHAALACAACSGAPSPTAEATEPAPATAPAPAPAFDAGPGRGDHRPFEHARRRGLTLVNREAPIPVQCYTKTGGVSNPCWTCHTDSTYPNLRSDADLQAEYSFSEYGTTNRWSNLFVDRSAAIEAIADDEVLAWIRQDNYSPLREILAGQTNEWAYGFDLDFARGFADDGFARDGSGWRAFRYKPFPGAFWPTNGSTDDVLVRLPAAFREQGGEPSLAVYAANLALLEASIASDPRLTDADVGLPSHYVGDAAGHALVRGTYPAGTEFLHSVRYLDPDATSLVATRMKELRWIRKERELPRERIFAAYETEAEEKYEGGLPLYGGNAETGLLNAFGWRVQGYIEDAQGRLRLQTYEEHYACMGCHSSIGVTADGTFSFARKVPGSAGWGYQDITEIPDVPQLGHRDPEVLTYLRRVGGGDELRANDEILARFFDRGVLDEAEVRRAAPGGDRKLPHLVAPSRERALRLNKAYLLLVREQSFERGRDVVLSPPSNVHARVETTTTGLAEANRIHRDGTLRLDWSAVDLASLP
jgi:hypothetical protein